MAHSGVRMIEERELKLAVDDDFELSEVPGNALESRVFTSTYYDAPDLRLARAGITLRRRVENGRILWQLKLPRGDHRLELEIPGTPAVVPAQFAFLLVGGLRGAELSPVKTLRTRRLGVRVTRDARFVADVVVDSVAILEGQRMVGEFRELEVESLDGDEKALATIGRRLEKAGARPTNGLPKALRALGLDPEPPPREDAEQLGAALRAQYVALVRADPAVRLDLDPEDLHDLRVAVRRLRAIIRATKSSLEQEGLEELREELRWLGGLLGPVRDLDVILAGFHADADELDAADRKALQPLFASLRRKRTAAKRAMLDGLGSDRYLAVLDRLAALVETPPVQPLSLRKTARREFRKLEAKMASLGPEPADEDLHDARIQAKRARYAAELAGPLVGGSAKRFVTRAKGFQDVVGAHQDAVVAEARLRSFAERASGSKAPVAVGRLVERQRARRLKAREQAPSAWAKLEKSGRRAWT